MKKIIYSMALVAGLSAISVGCSSEEQNLTQEMQATTSVEGGKIQFTLPKAFSSVQTYAIGGTADENAIVSSKVHALVFDALGTTLKGIFNQSSSNLTESSGVYTIDLNQEGDFKVMLLANLDLNTLNTPISVGDTYSTVIDKITMQDAVKTSGSFVMTSGTALISVNVDGTTGANMNTVHLERLAARFDFRNLVQGLQITQVKFKNRYKHSKLAASSANLNDSSKEDKTYTSSDFAGKPQTALFSVVYGYENVDSNATEFVLSGTYKNQPIEDVTVKLEKAVKRNHRYLINISESGSLDPNPTPTPPGTMPKLKFNIEVLDWNQGEKLKLDSSKLTINKPSKLEAPAVAIPGVTYNLLANPATATVEHNITQVTLSVVGNTGVTFVADVNNTGAYTPNLVSTEFTEAGEVKQTWEINFAANTTPAQVINKWKIKHQIDNSEVEFKLTHKGKPAGGLLTNKLSNSPIMKLSPYVVNKQGNGFVTNHDINNNQVGYFTWTQATGNSISISGYTLPTKEQWFTILPNYYEGDFSRVHYGSNNMYNNQNETNSLGTFQADYRNKQSEKTTYAVRFKNDADLKTAWRYKYVPGQALVIDIIPLNNALVNETINDVEQSQWWINNAGYIIKTITLPLYGYKADNIDPVQYRGDIAWFWTTAPYGGGAWGAYMDNGNTGTFYGYLLQSAFPLFFIQN